jgi:hypothetical protein
MEALAIILQLLRFVLAALAVYFCVALFRQHRRAGWLLLSALFAEPFLELVLRLLKGGAFFTTQTTRSAEGDILHVTYRLQLPILYYVAFIGLFILFREARRGKAA